MDQTLKGNLHWCNTSSWFINRLQLLCPIFFLSCKLLCAISNLRCQFCFEVGDVLWFVLRDEDRSIEVQYIVVLQITEPNASVNLTVMIYILHLCIWQMLLIKITCIAFKVDTLSVHAFVGNQTHGCLKRFCHQIFFCVKADKSERLFVFVQPLVKVIEDEKSVKQNAVWMTVIVYKLEEQRWIYLSSERCLLSVKHPFPPLHLCNASVIFC